MIAWIFALALAADPGTADVLTYPIGPGDELHLEIIGQPDMSGDLRVATDGTLTVPLAESVQVGGLTLDQARDAIVSHLSQGYLRSPQVILDIKTYASREVDVTGGVVKPESYPLLAGQTRVSQILLEAGGLVDANAPQAEIWRDVEGTRQVIPVDLERLHKGDPGADLELMPGDHLFVPPVDQVFVDGQVAKPGAIAYRDGMSITEAIIQAGSATGAARLAGVYIMRDGQRIDVNVKKIMRAKLPDVILQPADRVYIPMSAF